MSLINVTSFRHAIKLRDVSNCCIPHYYGDFEPNFSTESSSDIHAQRTLSFSNPPIRSLKLKYWQSHPIPLRKQTIVLPTRLGSQLFQPTPTAHWTEWSKKCRKQHNIMRYFMYVPWEFNRERFVSLKSWSCMYIMWQGNRDGFSVSNNDHPVNALFFVGGYLLIDVAANMWNEENGTGYTKYHRESHSLLLRIQLDRRGYHTPVRIQTPTYINTGIQDHFSEIVLSFYDVVQQSKSTLNLPSRCYESKVTRFVQTPQFTHDRMRTMVTLLTSFRAVIKSASIALTTQNRQKRAHLRPLLAENPLPMPL